MPFMRMLSCRVRNSEEKVMCSFIFEIRANEKVIYASLIN